MYAIFSSFTSTEDHAKHPLHCFQLLKRATIYIPKLLKIIPDDQLRQKLPSLGESYTGAMIGIADIQEYYDLDPLEIAKGKIKFDGPIKINSLQNHNQNFCLSGCSSNITAIL